MAMITDNSFVAEASQPLAHLADLFCYKGRPLNLDKDRPAAILVNHGYIVGYSLERKQPIWTAYQVSRARDGVDYERPEFFFEDPRLPQGCQIGTWSFGKHNGISYDRGHLVPNFAINTQYGRLAQSETFFMSNIMPQAASTNRGVWARLEKLIVKEYAPEKNHLWVMTGPIFGDDPYWIKRRNGLWVAIPESYFCIILDPVKYPQDSISNVEILAFDIPVDAGYVDPHDGLLSTVSRIEKKTNLNLFPKLTDRERKQVLPGRHSRTVWPSRDEMDRRVQ